MLTTSLKQSRKYLFCRYAVSKPLKGCRSKDPSCAFWSRTFLAYSGNSSLNSVRTPCRWPFTSDVVEDITVSTAAWERRCFSLISMIYVAACHFVDRPWGTTEEAKLSSLSWFVVDMSLLGPGEVGVFLKVTFEHKHWLERNLCFRNDSSLVKDLLHLLQ